VNAANRSGRSWRTLPSLGTDALQAAMPINGLSFALDGALVELAANAKASNDIPKIGLITGAI
jgi:hypothetical protein